MSLLKPETQKRQILTPGIRIRIARLWPSIIVIAVIFIICWPLIRSINEDLSYKIWYGTPWSEFWNCIWNDFTGYWWMTLALILNTIFLAIAGTVWIRLIVFRWHFKIMPWNVKVNIPEDTDTFNIMINRPLTNHATSFREAYTELMDIAGQKLKYLSSVLKNGDQIITRIKKRFWLLHDISQYFLGDAILPKISDYTKK